MIDWFGLKVLSRYYWDLLLIQMLRIVITNDERDVVRTGNSKIEAVRKVYTKYVEEYNRSENSEDLKYYKDMKEFWFSRLTISREDKSREMSSITGLAIIRLTIFTVLILIINGVINK